MKRNLLFILLLLCSSLSADYNSALKAYEENDFEAAYHEFYSMARMGEKRSQFNLGVMFYQGQYVEQNINKAYAWIKLATQGATASEQEKAALKVIAKQVDETEANKQFIELEQQFGTQALMDNLYPTIRPAKRGEQAKVIKIKEPVYPRNALKNGLQGYTKFQFDIDPNGKPRNIQLMDSFPSKVFDRASLKAIRQWTFEPVKNSDGNPVFKKNVLYKLEFRISAGNKGKKEVYVVLDNPLLTFKSFTKPAFPEISKSPSKYTAELALTFDADEKGQLQNLVIKGDARYKDAVIEVAKDWVIKTEKPLENIKAMVTFEKEMTFKLEPKQEVYQQMKQAAYEEDIQAQMEFGLMLEKFPNLEESGRQNEWYLKSAMKGHIGAQYLLGKNLLQGKGCVSDESKSIEWLMRAATSGQANAQGVLGEIYMDKDDLASHLKAKEYLQYAADKVKSQRVKLQLATHLLNSPFKEVRDPAKALKLLDSIYWSQIGDSITEPELKAKAYAAIGEFEEAVEYQEEALEEAEDGDFYSEGIRQQLLAYQAKLKSR